MRVRSLAASSVLAAAAIAVLPAAAASAAHSGSASAHAKPTASSTASHRPAKVVGHFTAVGKLASVDTTTGVLTVTVRGGSKDLRGHTVTISTTAKTHVVRHGAHKSISVLVVGDKITVVGVRTTAGLTATRLAAVPAHPAPAPTSAAPTTPAPSASVEPSDSPEPSTSPTA